MQLLMKEMTEDFAITMFRRNNEYFDFTANSSQI